MIMITWINRTTKLILKEEAMLIFNVDRNYFNSKIENIKTISADGVITLTNNTTWSREEFTKALEDKELEMVCDCLTCLVTVPNFSLSILACPSCKN